MSEFDCGWVEDEVDKFVIISIKPRFCEEILFYKEKNLELRRTKPTEISFPFKAYVYCTADKWKITEVIHKGEEVWGGEVWDKDTPLFIKIPNAPAHMFGKTKKIVGEITIDRIVEVSREDGITMINGERVQPWDDFKTKVTVKEFEKYKGNKEFLYGWHIADAVLYDIPKELQDFGLSRPPQSWQYYFWNRVML